MADTDVQIWGVGVGAVIKTLRKREGPSLKEKIWALRALVWSKNKAGGRGGGGRACPLDPPVK